mmetsp:Transcript_276/g.585  ORF Transcript_276/g.585 Transcript_276/m.585 type:complete len:107 (-) Transcript_276:1041-1361(-)
MSNEVVPTIEPSRRPMKIIGDPSHGLDKFSCEIRQSPLNEKQGIILSGSLLACPGGKKLFSKYTVSPEATEDTTSLLSTSHRCPFCSHRITLPAPIFNPSNFVNSP